MRWTTRYLLTLLALVILGSCSGPNIRPRIRVAVDGSVGPWSSLEPLNDPDHFQFLVVTDRTGGERSGVFEDAIRKINLLQPEFVVSVGDLIEGYTNEVRQIHAEWDEFDEFVARLDMPFFYVAGNHDYTNPVMAEIWKERYGPSYYHFVYKDVLFLCLNSEEKLDGHKSTALLDKQFDYFRKVLDAHPDVRWTLVFAHKPMWLYKDTVRWPEFEQLLSNRPHSVFAGHHHNYVKYERHDQSYLMLGTTGGGNHLRGVHYGEFDHVVWITMTDNGPLLANLMLEGIWDEDIRTEDDLRRVDGLMRSLRHEIAAMDDTQLTLRVRNDSDFEWDFECRMADHPAVSNSSTVRAKLAPNSLEIFTLDYQVSCEEFDPKKRIVMQQTFTTALEGEPDLVVDRSVRLPLCVASDDD